MNVSVTVPVPVAEVYSPFAALHRKSNAVLLAGDNVQWLIEAIHIGITVRDPDPVHITPR